MPNRMYNTHTLPTKKVVAAKEHACSWCDCKIKKSETHHYWRSVGDSFTENRMHPECLAAAIMKDEFLYTPKRNSRRAAAAALATSDGNQK